MNRTLLQQVGSFFYLVSPNETTFRNYDQVPLYVQEAMPLMALFAALDLALHWARGSSFRFSETLTSVAVGFCYLTTDLVTGWMVLAGYQWLYQYRLLDLPWDSSSTWFAGFILVDLAYYWIHRANHEVNLLWAIHQTHHSAEDYNLSVSLRLSFLQHLTHFGFYQPLALVGLPVATVAVHTGFNMLFQFWVHTDFIGTLGPFGWVFMTPSYHRVHHGANKWCLDKNYSSVLVVWDRIFGTFEPEKADCQIVYGLTDPPQAKNALWHQVFYFGEIWRKATSQSTWTDSLKAVFYGPGWLPGTPRLGDLDLLPEVKASRPPHDPQLPLWLMGYISLHVLLLTGAHMLLLAHYKAASWSFILGVIAFIWTGVGVMTAMFDGWRWAGMVEAARCLAYVTTHTTPITPWPPLDAFVVVVYAVSAIFWTTRATRMSHKIKSQ